MQKLTSFKAVQSIVFGINLLLSPMAMATEIPKYTLIRQDGDFEIRQYEPRIIAEVTATGDLDTASGEGFRSLAGFIFGDNHVAVQQPAKVPTVESSKIAMTAPVTVEPIKSEQSFSMAREWRVEFTMPSQYSLSTLPKPNNPSVHLKELPIKNYAVIRYSGMNTEHRINNEIQRLIDWVSAQNLELVGKPELARYNPPWTLPIFRRNEILIAIRQTQQN